MLGSHDLASAAWTHHQSEAITLDDAATIVPGVRYALEYSLYEDGFGSLTPREVRYVKALAALGPGPHAAYEISEQLGTRSEQLSSIRNALQITDGCGVDVVDTEDLGKACVVIRDVERGEQRLSLGDFIRRPREHDG